MVVQTYCLMAKPNSGIRTGDPGPPQEAPDRGTAECRSERLIKIPHPTHLTRPTTSALAGKGTSGQTSDSNQAEAAASSGNISESCIRVMPWRCELSGARELLIGNG